MLNFNKLDSNKQQISYCLNSLSRYILWCHNCWRFIRLVRSTNHCYSWMLRLCHWMYPSNRFGRNWTWFVGCWSSHRWVWCGICFRHHYSLHVRNRPKGSSRSCRVWYVAASWFLFQILMTEQAINLQLPLVFFSPHVLIMALKI